MGRPQDCGRPIHVSGRMLGQVVDVQRPQRLRDLALPGAHRVGEQRGDLRRVGLRLADLALGSLRAPGSPAAAPTETSHPRGAAPAAPPCRAVRATTAPQDPRLDSTALRTPAALPGGAEHQGDHRQRELARRRLRPRAEVLADPGEHPVPVGRVHDEQLGVRRDGGDQGLGRAPLGVRELGALRRRKQTAARSGPLGVRRPGPAGHSARGIVGPRPPSCSPATQSTRSSSLFHSPPSTPPGTSTRAISGSARVHVEPVHRLAAQHRVDRPVRQRDVLCRPAQQPRRRQPAAQLGAASPRQAPPR